MPIMNHQDVRLGQIADKLRMWVRHLGTAVKSKDKDMIRTCNRRIRILKREQAVELNRLKKMS